MLTMLNTLSKALSKKKDKPIMTIGKHNNFLIETESEQLKILNELSSRNKERIGIWLDKVEVNEDINKEPYIISPFYGEIYINKDISYISLYKWCVVNFEKSKLEKLPKPLNNMIIYYANKWKKYPKINPYTNNDIIVSLDPKGEYVRLYKEIINGLVSDILENKRRNILSIEECHKIKDSLPNEHAKVFQYTDLDLNLESTYQIYYDYLFIVYFIESRTIQYDTIFQSELNIYIDLAVYNISQFVYNESVSYIDYHYTTEFLYIHKFYKNYLLNTSDNELSISSLIMKLCIDIENILEYMRETQISKITNTVIDKVKFNMNVLKYCKEIFKKVPFNYFSEHIENPENKNDRVLVKEYLLLILTKHEKNITKRYKNIYDTIMNYIEEEEYPASNVFETFLSIYNNILKLYSDNKKNAIYKNFIKDPYNINKGIEPQIPIKQQLPRDLQMYKIRLNNLKNAIKTNANLSTEKKLKEFEENNSSNRRKLIEYEENLKDYDEKMKKYKLKKDIYDRIYEGKYSPKKRNELLSLNAYNRLKKGETLLQVSKRKTKSESLRHKTEYSHEMKAFTTISNKNKTKYSNSYNEVVDYYTNDTDPYTQEAFIDMNPKKQKYVSDIVYYDGKKEYHYRFDTVNMYNYILKCIDTCETPINFFNRTELTDANLDEICNKIKYFTKKPTYNSSSDIRAILKDCSKYDNLLQFSWKEIIEEQDKEREIIGIIKVYLFINLGNIMFKVTPQEVLTLPIFNINILKTFPNYTLMILEDKLLVGELIGSKFFPYRKNKPILNLPEFAFKLTDKAEKISEELKKYNEKIVQL